MIKHKENRNHFVQEYIDNLGINYSQAARQIGTSRQRLNQIFKGDRIGPKLAVQIWKWSQGELRLQDMRPDIW